MSLWPTGVMATLCQDLTGGFSSQRLPVRRLHGWSARERRTMTTGRLVTQRWIRYGPFQTYAIEDYDPLTTVSIPNCLCRNYGNSRARQPSYTGIRQHVPIRLLLRLANESTGKTELASRWSFALVVSQMQLQCCRPGIPMTTLKWRRLLYII